MHYCILGPLELSDDGRMIEVTGAKQRALLAILLLNANRVVSSDRLIDLLWEDRAPETAGKALQVHISQLRKLLGRDRLQTKAPGYSLSVDEGALDVHQFEALVRHARDGSPADAAAALRDALALWRGPPLADFVFDRFAQPEIVRLEELYLDAVEERFEADLTLGRHRALVGELEALVAQHPLRERLRAQLMLALYRSGRQADALDAYQDARRALVDELGIDPGRSLRDLEQAILLQDSSLDAAIETQTDPERTADAQAPEPELHGPVQERKLATVLFADLVGHEMQPRDPERVRAELHRLYDAMVEEVHRAGGHAEKLIGNTAMAVFGVPVAREDHAARALHAALAMQTRFEDLTGERRGIGVDTGEVLADRTTEGGAVAMGDAVGAAGRLAEAAGRGDILVGARTVAAARGFEFGDAHPSVATGTGSPIACQALVGVHPQGRPRGVSGLGRSFVGREQEVELLRSAYGRIVDRGEPHLVTVAGDAGVGKTSLTRQLTEWLAAHPSDPLLRVGRCLPYGRGITYWPLGEVLKDHLGLIESDPPETVLGRLGEHTILGLTLGLDVASGLHPLVARERLHEAWVELVDQFVADRPAVLVVEDLHWAEEPLLDLLDRLVRDVSGPLLLVVTARPERADGRSPWGVGHRHVTQIWLEPLSLEDASRMLERLLGEDVPAPLRELVVEQAEGNPFFVEELVAALIDRRYLVRVAGRWRLRDLPARTSVPDSIESLLAARIDLLGPSEKAALQAASVIGRVFWADPVRELLGGVDADLGVLVERDFIRRRPRSSMAGEREFSFKHALTRDVGYESVPRSIRAHLHATFAAWIERIGGGRDEHAPLLAHHYLEAVKPEDADLAWPGEEHRLEALRTQARAWLSRAAELAGARYALDDQISLLRGAVELERSTSGQVRLWRQIAHANALKYDDEAFREAMTRAIDASSDEAELVGLYAEWVFECSVRWQLNVDRARIDEWSAFVLERSGSETRSRAQALVARAICHPEEAEAAALEAESIARRVDEPELYSYALYTRADVALAAGLYEGARRIVEDRLSVIDRIANPDHQADACWAALPAYLVNGQFADARRIAHRHDEITARLSTHHRLHGVAVLLEVEQLAGNWGEIRELTPRAEQAAEQNTTRCLHNRLALLTCALASVYLGDDQEARRLERRSEASGVDLYGRTESLIWLSLQRGDLAAIERLLDELERPRKSFLRSRKLAPVAARLDGLAALDRRETLEHDAPQLLRPGTYLEPFAMRALGIVREDEILKQRAVERFEALGLNWHAEQTRP